MRNYLFNIFCICFVLSFYSCSESQEDIFNEAPNQRIQKSKSDLKNLLVGQTQGWQLLYFPLVEEKYSDMERNLKGSENYSLTQREFSPEKFYGRGGHNIFMKFKENGEVDMLYDGDFNSSRNIKTSNYAVSQNTYVQLDFISPNYIFQTGQTGFLFYKKNEDGSLIFTTNKYPQRDKEYIMLKPLESNVEWKAKMANVFQTKLIYERNERKVLSITNPLGEEIFNNSNYVKKYDTNTKLRYSVFFRNMQPHRVFDSRYYAGLGSGYMPMENKILFIPGIKVNNDVIFTVFEKKGNSFEAEVNGYKAVIN